LGGGDDADGGDDALTGADGGDDEGGDDDDGGLEIVGMADNVAYLAPVLRMLALLHTFTAIAMMIGYYCLKVRPRTVNMYSSFDCSHLLFCLVRLFCRTSSGFR
jgi:hypothetical protein